MASSRLALNKNERTLKNTLQVARVYLDKSVLLVSGGGARFIETACNGLGVFKTPRSDFGIQVLRIAYKSRGCPEHVLLYSDQGCHYTSRAFRQQLCRYQLEQSMSRRGHCWDNSVMERFFRRLKSERLHHLSFINHGTATHCVDHYIYFYNYKRLHASLAYITPVQKMPQLKKVT